MKNRLSIGVFALGMFTFFNAGAQFIDGDKYIELGKPVNFGTTITEQEPNIETITTDYRYFDGVDFPFPGKESYEDAAFEAKPSAMVGKWYNLAGDGIWEYMTNGTVKITVLLDDKLEGISVVGVCNGTWSKKGNDVVFRINYYNTAYKVAEFDLEAYKSLSPRLRAQVDKAVAEINSPAHKRKMFKNQISTTTEYLYFLDKNFMRLDDDFYVRGASLPALDEALIEYEKFAEEGKKMRLERDSILQERKEQKNILSDISQYLHSNKTTLDEFERKWNNVKDGEIYNTDADKLNRLLREYRMRQGKIEELLPSLKSELPENLTQKLEENKSRYDAIMKELANFKPKQY